jgi:hypothetical protein
LEDVAGMHYHLSFVESHKAQADSGYVWTTNAGGYYQPTFLPLILGLIWNVWFEKIAIVVLKIAIWKCNESKLKLILTFPI